MSVLTDDDVRPVFRFLDDWNRDNPGFNVTLDASAVHRCLLGIIVKHRGKSVSAVIGLSLTPVDGWADALISDLSDRLRLLRDLLSAMASRYPDPARDN